ncbi:MAG TPA: ABC transporter permease [Candidatus Methylomirabilis sp.]|nr:ABC transporter permease [Candidatus Methylomirabilis sp.]
MSVWRAVGPGGVVLLALVLVAAIAPALAPHDVSGLDLLHRLAPPAWGAGGSWAHPFGTDLLGRDVLSRVIFGARTSLAIAGAAMLAAAALGILLGLVSGYAGSWGDALIMRVADIQLSFPYLLLAIAVMALLRPSLTNLVIVLVLRSWVVYARLVRVVTLSAREREFVTAARAIGAGAARILFRHIAPNVVGASIVVSSFQLAELIIVESSLSFLGLGVQPPTPSWGGMVSEGRAYVGNAWWLSAFPGLAIVLAVLGANLTGDALRRALDPRLRGV